MSLAPTDGVSPCASPHVLKMQPDAGYCVGQISGPPRVRTAENVSGLVLYDCTSGARILSECCSFVPTRGYTGKFRGAMSTALKPSKTLDFLISIHAGTGAASED